MIRALSLSLVLLGALSLSPAAAQEPMDLSKLVSAPGHFFLGDEVKLGYRLERETEVAGTTSREFIAVVGETEETWEVESNQGLSGFARLPAGKGIVLALVVDKKTLAVRSARLGKPGEALKKVRVLEGSQGPKDVKAKKPDREETLELESGNSVAVEVYVTKVGDQSFTSKVGKKGTPYEGVLFSNVGAPGSGSFVLSGDPSETKLELEDKDAEGKARTLDTITVSFTNGYAYTYSQDPVARAFYSQVVKIASKSFSAKVVSLRTDAKKTLNWN